MAREDIFEDTATDLGGDGIEDSAPEFSEADTVVTEAPVTDADEAVEAEAPVEAEPTDEEKAAAEAEAAAEAAEHEATVEAFKAAADAAVAEADSETGTVTEANLDKVSNAYREVTGGIKYKNQAKAHVAEEMKNALTSGPDGYSKAAAYNEVNEAILTATAKAKASPKPKAPSISPAQAYAERVAVVAEALRLLEENAPEEADGWEGVDVEVDASALYAFDTDDSEDKGEAPESTPLAKAAVKVALGKAAGTRPRSGGSTGSTYSGPRRDVGAHILHAFEGVESGTFLTVAEIRAVKSPEYGDDAPSAGAISARLFPKSGKVTLAGVIPGENDKGVNGATKQ